MGFHAYRLLIRFRPWQGPGFKFKGKIKLAPFVPGAFNTQYPSHELHKLLADRKAQPGPAVCAGYTLIFLLKTAEDLCLVFRADPDSGILYKEKNALPAIHIVC